MKNISKKIYTLRSKNVGSPSTTFTDAPRSATEKSGEKTMYRKTRSLGSKVRSVGSPSTTFTDAPRSATEKDSVNTADSKPQSLGSKVRSVGSPSTTFTGSPRSATEKDSVNTADSKPQSLGSKSGAGFTIIELLVVIAIIAVLSSIVMIALGSAKEKGRDARRVSDMNEIQKALNLYFADNNRFPIITSPVNITGSDAFSVEIESAGIISKTPIDPINTGVLVYSYVSSVGGIDYIINFCMETNSIQKYPQGCGNTISP